MLLQSRELLSYSNMDNGSMGRQSKQLVHNLYLNDSKLKILDQHISSLAMINILENSSRMLYFLSSPKKSN